MKILVLNCGSSSIKYQLFDMATEEVLAKGEVEKLGLKGSQLIQSLGKGKEVVFQGEILDHKVGVEYILGVISSDKYGCIKSLSEIDAVGHRVVHGADKFKSSVLINDEVKDQLEKCIELAPLHNPPNLKGITAVDELMPNVPQVGVFDTAFHQTMPERAYMYGVPYKLYEKYGIRRYGFHGTSHRYVCQRACDMLGVDIKTQKIVSCHLGNGASVAAIKYGESIDTSMGLTPIEGLVMGTRTGDLDIGVVGYIIEKEDIDIETANVLFNKHSGMFGLSGVSSDMREIESAKADGNERAAMALDLYNYRVKKYIGAYTAAMNGIDILIFTGGIGNNASSTRSGVSKDLDYLGIKLDESKNTSLRGVEVDLSHSDSKVKVLSIPTDEELMIALDTKNIVQNIK
ncbi:MAG: acetate/propionate family kinase [Bacteroidales bacterium]